MKTVFLFLYDTVLIFKDKHDGKELQVTPFSSNTKKVFYLREMLFIQATNIGHLNSLLFVFAADETVFNKFIWLDNETGMDTKDNQLKVEGATRGVL